MKKNCFRISYFLLLSVFGFNCCIGQILKQPSKITSPVNRQLKLKKTQGSGPGANVHCSLQDRAGNLWFGTTGEGVYKYDGKYFTNYTVKDGLSSNHIASLMQDRSGIIWFSTADGACSYDGKKFTKISIALITGSSLYTSINKPYVDQYGNPSEENAVWNIMQDKSGKFWFGTSKGVYRYDGKTFSSLATGSNNVQIEKAEYILEDKKGNIWIGGRMNKGVICFDGKTLINLKPDGDKWLWPVLNDKSGNIWFTNWGAIYRYDGRRNDEVGQEKTFSAIKGACNTNNFCMIEDKHGNIWSGSDNANAGLCRYDKISFTHFTNEDGVFKNAVTTLLEDKSGNIWIGTRNMGLYRFDGKQFVKFSE